MDSTDQRSIPLSLFVFSIFYGGMVCIAGVLGNKQVALGPLAVEAGIFAFLTLVATSSATAELHGPATANRLVLFGFAPLLFSIVLTAFVLALPPSHDMPADRLSAFGMMMGSTPRIWLGGILRLRDLAIPQRHHFQQAQASRGARPAMASRGHRKRSKPDRRHADFHHHRFLWRIPDPGAFDRPDDRKG